MARPRKVIGDTLNTTLTTPDNMEDLTDEQLLELAKARGIKLGVERSVDSEPPVAFKYRPDRHYVKVQTEARKGDDYESPIDEYLDRGYIVESDDRKVTGSRFMTLLSCPMELHKQHLKEVADEAHIRARGYAAADKDQAGNAIESSFSRGAISLS